MTRITRSTMTIWDTIASIGILPVVTIDRVEDAGRLGGALQDAGLQCAEITFRTSAAAGAIERIAAECADIIVGAGTVLTTDQAQQAVDAGARFIISPGFDAEVVDWCREHGVPTAPGVATPSELMMAIKHRLTVVKFFPAEALGGLKTLKAISEPFGGMRFIPTGGINPANMGDYLRLPAVAACGGSWIVNRELIADGKWDDIRQRAGEALALVQQVRVGA
jgi:2-dehydro-3-deoxyphosphogluconate aldolase / (4S)-4-hydroxy-2-oxoglutarate aldolase